MRIYLRGYGRYPLGKRLLRCRGQSDEVHVLRDTYGLRARRERGPHLHDVAKHSIPIARASFAPVSGFHGTHDLQVLACAPTEHSHRYDASKGSHTKARVANKETGVP